MPFNTGDTATGATALKIEIDLEKLGTPEAYKGLCVNAISEALNYMVENWADLCNGGVTSTALVGIDPTYSGDMVMKKDETSMDIAKLRFDITAMSNIPVKITNEFYNEVLEFNATFTKFDTTLEANALIKTSFEFKPVTSVVPTEIPVVPAI